MIKVCRDIRGTWCGHHECHKNGNLFTKSHSHSKNIATDNECCLCLVARLTTSNGKNIHNKSFHFKDLQKECGIVGIGLFNGSSFLDLKQQLIHYYLILLMHKQGFGSAALYRNCCVYIKRCNNDLNQTPDYVDKFLSSYSPAFEVKSGCS